MNLRTTKYIGSWSREGAVYLKGLPGVLEKNLEIPVHFFKIPDSLTLKKKISEDLFSKKYPFSDHLLGLVTQTQPFVNLSFEFSAPRAPKSLSQFLKPALATVLSPRSSPFLRVSVLERQRAGSKLKKEIISREGQLARVGKPVEELARLEKEEAGLNSELEGFPQDRDPKTPLK